MTRFGGVLLAIFGCQAARASDPAPSGAPGERFERDMMIRYHMHENFGLLRSIELLFVHGRLDDGRALARLIAEAPEEPGLAPFARRAMAVRDGAAGLASAPDIDEACRREARLAAACADCHDDAGVLPEFTHPPRLPPDTGTISARMARHLWATDRLWEGVVGDSSESWRAGLDILATTPLPGSVLDAERQPLAHQLQQLATTARDAHAASRPRDRARDYGEILVTCAACHRAKQ